MARESESLSPQELQSRIKKLQSEVTRFIVVKQDLIDTQGLLDREQSRFKGIQACSEELLRVKDMETFTTILLESILHTFEFEVSLFTRFDSHRKCLDVIGQAGFDEPPTSLPFEIDWFECSTGVILPSGHELLEKWASAGLGEAIICPFFSEKDNSLAGLVLGGLTIENLGHFDPINAEVISSFSVMVAQAGALLSNHDLKSKLQEQNIQLEQHSKNLESIVEERTKELRQANERFRTLSEAAFEGIIVIEEGKVVDANKQFEDITGYGHDELINMSVLDLVSPDYHELVLDRIKTGYDKPYEIIGIKKDKVSINLNVSGKSLSYRDKNIRVTAVRDITERKQSEEALRESEGLLAETQRIAHLGSWEFEVATQEIKWSDEAFRIAGMEIRDKLTLDEYMSIVHPEDLPLLQKTLDKSTAERTPYELELRHLRPDGTYNQTLTRGRPVIEDNHVVKFVGSVQDIAERKRFEEELKHYATTDAMTGIANRRAGMLFLDNHVQISKRNKTTLSVCFVDINDLKDINDTYGHEEGDNVIRIACETIRESLRESDFICRLGGDEFLIIFPQCSIESALEIWERVETRLEALNNEKSKHYAISLSQGFAESGPENFRSPEEMVSIADKEMYKNKHQ